ncbi:MAG TPA: hypothetical protein VFQ61_17835 [Polyangiaceae bacterium]|nr:hypothetical protein [Polyangiaceae bacterium]
MGRNPWQDDPDLAALRPRTGSTRWGRVFVGLVLVASATFAGAYYLPLFQAHGTLTAEHRKVIDRAQELDRNLNRAQAELKKVTQRRDELEAERAKREAGVGRSNAELEHSKADLANKLDKAIKRNWAQVATTDGHPLVGVADAAVFVPKKLEVSPAGKQLLCTLAQAADNRELRVAAVDGNEPPAPQLVASYPNALALRAARAALIAFTLETECKVSGARLKAIAAGGASSTHSAFGASKLPDVHLEIEIVDAPTALASH